MAWYATLSLKATTSPCYKLVHEVPKTSLLRMDFKDNVGAMIDVEK